MGRDLEEPAGLKPLDWHTRYLLQSGWTAEIRKYLYQRASIQDARRILEVGCGSGVICSGLHHDGRSDVVGLDIDLSILRLAKDLDKPGYYTNGDAMSLPFSSQTFDSVVCHYFLLWVTDPGAALKEMVRVCRSGGSVLALAEPDFGGRIDYPDELIKPGKLQADSLKRQGADPLAGRQLSSWFHRAGLVAVEYGVLGGQWRNVPEEATRASEWLMLKHDLEGILSSEELEQFRIIEENAWKDGSRVLFIPTFYAFGRAK
ncbi:MAG: methyltransferase domain-containing protein [Anaerolineaceae bacterium]